MAAPDTGTCRSAGVPRVIDYFIVDKRIRAGILKVEVDLSFPSSPHSMVRMIVRKSATADLTRVLVRPMKFPAEPPIGCNRKPEQGRLCGISNSMTEDPQLRLDEAFQELYSRAEEELCGKFDKVDKDGSPEQAYCGRGGVTTTKIVTAAPTKGAEFGHLDKKGQSLKWFEVRSAEIASLAAKARRSGVTEGMQRHFDRIAAKLRSAKHALAGMGDERDMGSPSLAPRLLRY